MSVTFIPDADFAATKDDVRAGHCRGSHAGGSFHVDKDLVWQVQHNGGMNKAHYILDQEIATQGLHDVMASRWMPANSAHAVEVFRRLIT